jgi:hypothetical protein
MRKGATFLKDIFDFTRSLEEYEKAHPLPPDEEPPEDTGD